MTSISAQLNDSSGAHPWTNGIVSEAPALFIVGSYRCGTTSIFRYLADHPEINPCSIKEPGFFFSRRILEKPSAYPAGHECWAYLSMFRRKPPAHVLLEGTANYLNDPGCAERIRAAFPNARIVIALRDPVSRLLSWYKFILHRGWWPAQSGFEEWVNAQLRDTRPLTERPYHLQAFEHGFYSGYIAKYFQVFGKDRVKIVWFDDLIQKPTDCLVALSEYAGISTDFYNSYRFPKENEAMKITRPRALALYRKIHRGILRLFTAFPRFHHSLKVILYGHIEPKIIGLFTGSADPLTVSGAVQDDLRARYCSDLAKLQDITGRVPPWKNRFEKCLSQQHNAAHEV